MDPVMDFSDQPETVAPPPSPATSTRRRGRPRSPETIERDRQVLDVLRDGGPQTREHLVEKLGGIKPSLVYLALWRLRREGHVERAIDGGERHVWHVTS